MAQVTVEEIERLGKGVFAEKDNQGLTGEAYYYDGNNAKDIADIVNTFTLPDQYEHFNSWDEYYAQLRGFG